MKKMILVIIAVLVVAKMILPNFSSGNTDISADRMIHVNAGGREAEGSAGRTVECSLCHGDGVCYHCDGEGFRNGRRCRVCEGAGSCDSCGGSGVFQVMERGSKDYTVCGSCHGDGTCGACDGTGEMGYQSSTLGYVGGDCMLCNGSGKCLSCKGNGVRELSGF